ncbi:acyltransferase family protein [Corallincola spongiicola]|uniref:Acyltransferase n=1 Tax=Corallincola spongiicola TaxID=2520508 RepID=A0ABY1WRA5_9GAMM|nr:acyltransferase family protein [Corallincola spongiicola]TAA47260.1 acyltransferase [Corallincola spongiicola]
MRFRKDINGLRAIAVIAVVLFHFNASWMPGGFAGVDVFFVISGFLMTGIIFRGFEQENFSILKFYVARANRIIPALAVLCLVLLVFGWFYLTPLDYKALGKHVGSSMSFLSNIIYWRESGYFDATSHEKWLLHTWSLSAEWQFYIIYPLVLVAMRKFMSLKAMKATILVGTVLGFIFCVIVTYKWPNSAYYLLPTRAWEMMIGGVAYLYPLKFAENRKKAFEWFGLTLIILSYIFISKENLWPGYLALIPVLGAFLLVQAQRNDSAVTGNVLFQLLGKWSYSIYLWHWPLVVLSNYYSIESAIFLIIFSVFIGFLSYRFVESNFVNNNSVNWISIGKPLIICLFVIFFSTLPFNDVYLNKFENDGFFDKNVDIRNDWFYPKESETIKGVDINFVEGVGKENVLFLGDSLIQQYYILTKERSVKNNLFFLTESGCFPVSGFKYRGGHDCHNFMWLEKIINEVNFSKVVVTGNLDQYLLRNDNFIERHDGFLVSLDTIDGKEELRRRIIELFNILSEKTDKAYYIFPTPKGDMYDYDYLGRLELLGNGSKDIAFPKNNNVEYKEFIIPILNEFDVEIIDPQQFLCKPNCSPFYNGYRLTHRDSSHLSASYVAKEVHYLDFLISN